MRFAHFLKVDNAETATGFLVSILFTTNQHKFNKCDEQIENCIAEFV